MKIITCASYYGSGSSALTDFVSEYSSVKDLTDFEFRFLHDLDGVSDLEYHLVENHNRHNSGHALKRFKKLMKFNNGNILSKRYSQFFKDDEFINITNEYLNELIDFSYPGWWFYDLYDKGVRMYYLYQIANHLVRKIPLNSIRILKNERTICTHPDPEKFLYCTQNYVSKLMKALNKEEKEYIVIDQIVPSSNIERVLRYFKDDIYVFIVDRDPRDIYLLGKYYWKDGICPSDVDLFCKWYEYARKAGKGIPTNNSNIVKLKFEDFIYKYSEIEKLIEQITGLRNIEHNNKFSRLNPLRSVNNTQLWKRHNDEGIQVIEKKLWKYLYDYSTIKVDKIKEKSISDLTPF